MQLRTELEIAAPAPRIWGILTDFQRYHEWNPFITDIKGELVPGSLLELTVSLPEGSEHRLRPRVLRCEPNRELSWLGHLWFKGLFDGEHFFRLEELGPERTRFIQGENFAGILVRFLRGALTKTSRGFVYMNQALKRRAEAP